MSCDNTTDRVVDELLTVLQQAHSVRSGHTCMCQPWSRGRATVSTDPAHWRVLDPGGLRMVIHCFHHCVASVNNAVGLLCVHAADEEVAISIVPACCCALQNRRHLPLAAPIHPLDSLRALSPSFALLLPRLFGRTLCCDSLPLPSGLGFPRSHNEARYWRLAYA